MAEPNIHPTVVDIQWGKTPDFKFDTEVDALMTLQDLSVELEAARRQVREVMRYMVAAVKAAGEVRDEAGWARPQAIVSHSGLARQTVYDILGGRRS